MADTGLTVFAPGFLADDFFATGFFANDAAVVVPDVVGELEAAGTATIQGAGLLVAVATAYSSTVAVGVIISQSPAAGSSSVAGATVTITVSLGAAPVSEATGGFYSDYSNYSAQNRRRKRVEDIEQEVEDIPDAVEREIATLIKTQEAIDEERGDLARLQALADRYAKPGVDVPRPILASVMKAHEERTKNALEQMNREINRMMEDEEAAVLSMLMLDD